MNEVNVDDLIHRVVIEVANDAPPDPFNQVAAQWATTGVSRYVGIKAMTGRLLWEARQVVPDVTHEIVMRYFAFQPGKKYRLRWGSRIFNLESWTNPGEQKQGTVMRLVAIEQV